MLVFQALFILGVGGCGLKVASAGQLLRRSPTQPFAGSVASGAAVAVIVTVLVVLTLHVAGVVRKRGRHRVGGVVATELPVILMSVSLGLWLGYGVAALGVLILVSPPSIT